ncbi:MAG: SRPBCC family protein [Candidatus Melainabacteria bacterium]|nr:SRPBCC family protein [Candidatus Melainabacteria bacterium]
MSTKSALMSTPLNGVIHAEQAIGKKDFVVSKTLVHATPEKVFEVVTDYLNAVRYFTNLTGCQVLSENNGVKHVRFSAKATGIMKLDYVLAIDESKPLRVEWTRIKGSFKANEGYWDLTPIDGGKSTLVTYAKHVDPGFFAPKMFVHKTLRDTAENIFRDLKRHVESPRIAVDSHSKKIVK